MDRQRRHLIALGCALAAFAASAAAQHVSPLRESGWLADEGRLAALTIEPVLDREALANAAFTSAMADQYTDAQDLRFDLIVGEFLFKSPLLLGGQAAKAGLSCHSCHVNGRDNPAFQFPAISGKPGTADTTHNFFSETLGNGTFDPVPIPDLTEPGKVRHDIDSEELEGFIKTIVVDEFGGSNADEALIRPLAAFVRAVRLSGGRTGASTRSLQRDLEDARMMVEQARRLTAANSSAVSTVLLAGARDRLFVVYERLLPNKHSSEREWLVEQSRNLGRAQSLLRQEKSVSGQLDQWLADFGTAPDFTTVEPESLYNPVILKSALTQ
ncbi:MAG: hypothetical protein AAGK01_02370 [Pseudomonadota bacterium]